MYARGARAQKWYLAGMEMVDTSSLIAATALSRNKIAISALCVLRTNRLGVHS